jgi:serine/threonine-protein kinase HipA
VTKGEILALRLATAAGIKAAHGDLIDSDGAPVAMIKRFDRSDAGDRIPYISAATMLGADSGDRDIHTYTEIVDALRIHGAASREDIEELWRRIAFSILITNVDDHLHNHGFLHSSGHLWRLAPAFDMNPFPERHRELKTWISEDTGPDASIAALWSVQKYFNISLARAKAILGEVESAVARWREVGRVDAHMSNEELSEFEDAFEHSERPAARALVSGK